MESIEEWKPIIGYESAYEISTYSRIRSLDRIVKSNKYGTRKINSKILTPSNNGEGYLRVGLYKNSVYKHLLVSVLVAKHFIPNPLNLPIVDHIDGNPANNAISNLQWISHSDNVIKGHYVDCNNKSKKAIKPILQYTKQLEFVAEHKSISKAQRLFTPNSSVGVIANNLRNPKIYKSAYGFIWKYK